MFSAHLAPINIISQRKGWGIITGVTKTEDRADIQGCKQEIVLGKVYFDLYDFIQNKYCNQLA